MLSTWEFFKVPEGSTSVDKLIIYTKNVYKNMKTNMYSNCYYGIRTEEDFPTDVSREMMYEYLMGAMGCIMTGIILERDDVVKPMLDDFIKYLERLEKEFGLISKLAEKDLE